MFVLFIILILTMITVSIYHITEDIQLSKNISKTKNLNQNIYNILGYSNQIQKLPSNLNELKNLNLLLNQNKFNYKIADNLMNENICHFNTTNLSVNDHNNIIQNIAFILINSGKNNIFDINLINNPIEITNNDDIYQYITLEELKNKVNCSEDNKFNFLTLQLPYAQVNQNYLASIFVDNGQVFDINNNYLFSYNIENKPLTLKIGSFDTNVSINENETILYKKLDIFGNFLNSGEYKLSITSQDKMNDIIKKDYNLIIKDILYQDDNSTLITLNQHTNNFISQNNVNEKSIDNETNTTINNQNSIIFKKEDDNNISINFGYYSNSLDTISEYGCLWYPKTFDLNKSNITGFTSTFIYTTDDKFNGFTFTIREKGGFNPQDLYDMDLEVCGLANDYIGYGQGNLKNLKSVAIEFDKADQNLTQPYDPLLNYDNYTGYYHLGILKDSNVQHNVQNLGLSNNNIPVKYSSSLPITENNQLGWFWGDNNISNGEYNFRFEFQTGCNNDCSICHQDITNVDNLNEFSFNLLTVYTNFPLECLNADQICWDKKNYEKLYLCEDMNHLNQFISGFTHSSDINGSHVKIKNLELYQQERILIPSATHEYKMNNMFQTMETPILKDENNIDGTNNNVIDDLNGKICLGKSFQNGNNINFGNEYNDIFGSNNSLNLTITLWVKPTLLDNMNSNHGTSNILLAKASDAYNDNFELGISNNGQLELYLDTDVSDSMITIGNSNDIKINEWNYIALSFNNGILTTMLNENIYNNTNFTNGLIDNADGSDFTLGLTTHSDNYFTGSIDELKIWNSTLTLNELKLIRERELLNLNYIDEQYIECTIEEIIEIPQAIAEYHFDELIWNGTNNEILDSSGNNFHGKSLGASIVDELDKTDFCRVASFDGIDDMIELSNLVNQFDNEDNITISLWFKNTDVNSHDRGILSTLNTTTGGDEYLGLRYDSDGWGGNGNDLIKFSLNEGSNNYNIETLSNLQNNNIWEHLVLTWEKNKIPLLYLNGNLINYTYFNTNNGTNYHNTTDYYGVGTNKTIHYNLPILTEHITISLTGLGGTSWTEEMKIDLFDEDNQLIETKSIISNENAITFTIVSDIPFKSVNFYGGINGSLDSCSYKITDIKIFNLYNDVLNNIETFLFGRGNKDNNYFKGFMDEITFFDQRLNLKQIKKMYNSYMDGKDYQNRERFCNKFNEGIIGNFGKINGEEWTYIPYNITFENKPVIFYSTDTSLINPQFIRIKDVSKTGFYAKLFRPKDNYTYNNEIQNTNSFFPFIAITKGNYNINGLKIEVDTINTKKIKAKIYHNNDDKGYYDVNPLSFNKDFIPVFAIQTINNEQEDNQTHYSNPFLAITSIKQTNNNIFQVALERAETLGKNGMNKYAILNNEEIGYLVVDSNTYQNFTDLTNKTIYFESNIVTNVKNYGSKNYNYNSNYNNPIPILSQITRNGGDGGWPRYDNLSNNNIDLYVQEDVTNDSEVTHTNENFAIIIFSEPFYKDLN